MLVEPRGMRPQKPRDNTSAPHVLPPLGTRAEAFPPGRDDASDPLRHRAHTVRNRVPALVDRLSFRHPDLIRVGFEQVRELGMGRVDVEGLDPVELRMLREARLDPDL